MNKIAKIVLPLLLLPVVYGIWIHFSRAEVVTPAVAGENFSEFQPASVFCAGKSAETLNFAPGQENELQAALNNLNECTTVQLGAGRFVMKGSVTLAGVNGITLRGAGMNATTIQFVDAGNVNGIDVESSNNFTIRDMTVLDSPKNAVEIRLSENVHIDRVKVTWSNTQGPERSKNGAYGFYPVNVVNVLIENSESYYASDAGLYIGQCINALARNNRAEWNVMGLEIENTVNADVHDNILTNNSAGFLVYDLSKNDIVTRNVRVHRNLITNNNNDNFASAGIVKAVPSGLGMIMTSARKVEVFNNTFGDNHTTDIALFSGLIAQSPDFGTWKQNNFRMHSVYIHDNKFNGGSGSSVDNGRLSPKDRPLGLLIDAVWKIVNEERKAAGKAPANVPNITYDGVDDGRTLLALTNTMFGNKKGNLNNICIGENKGGKIEPSFGDINMPSLLNNSEEPTDESMRATVQSGDLVFYENASENYGGQPNEGFSCEGFVATDVPVNFDVAAK